MLKTAGAFLSNHQIRPMTNETVAWLRDEGLESEALELFARNMTLKDAVELRIRIPCAPTELAASTGAAISSVRQALNRLRAEGLAEMLDKTVPVESKRGRKHEHLWQRK